MIIGGLFNAMEGVVALARNEVYVATPRYLFAFDLTTWGWIRSSSESPSSPRALVW